MANNTKSDNTDYNSFDDMAKDHRIVMKSIINKDEKPYTKYPFDVDDLDVRLARNGDYIPRYHQANRLYT